MNSANVSINRKYQIDKSAGANPAAKYRGMGISSAIAWPEGTLTEEDYPDMVEMVDALKQGDDQALIFFPQVTRPEAILGAIDSDEIQFNDIYNFQPNDGRNRKLSCAIPLRGVMFP